MKKTIILTIILFMTMTTVVGCGTKEPIHTNDLLYRETKEELGAFIGSFSHNK